MQVCTRITSKGRLFRYLLVFWLRAATMAGFTATVSMVGCVAPPQEPTICGCQERHCVRPQSCESSAQCPTGTACLPAHPDVDELACATSEPQAGPGSTICRVPPPDTDARTALIAGFRADRFTIDRLRGSEPASFTLNGPDEAVAAVCALFGCVPQFTSVGTSPLAGHELIEIANFDDCVLALEKLAPSGVFDLARQSYVMDTTPSRERDMDACMAGDMTVSYAFDAPLITDLLVGCWAYDDTRLIAASPLESLDPDEVPRNPQIVPMDEDCSGGDFTPCYRRDVERFGICHEDVCRARCREPVDCELDGQEDPGSGECQWKCVTGGPYVGACDESEASQ